MQLEHLVITSHPVTVTTHTKRYKVGQVGIKILLNIGISRPILENKENGYRAKVIFYLTKLSTNDTINL